MLVNYIYIYYPTSQSKLLAMFIDGWKTMPQFCVVVKFISLFLGLHNKPYQTASVSYIASNDLWSHAWFWRKKELWPVSSYQCSIRLKRLWKSTKYQEPKRDSTTELLEYKSTMLLTQPLESRCVILTIVKGSDYVSMELQLLTCRLYCPLQK
jgi:hypothetical protein